MVTDPYLSVITLSVNELNAPTKRQWLVKRHKNKIPLYAVYKKPTSNLVIHRGWKWSDGKRFHANGDQKKAGIAILISDKTDFEIKAVKRDKDDTT